MSDSESDSDHHTPGYRAFRDCETPGVHSTMNWFRSGTDPAQTRVFYSKRKAREWIAEWDQHLSNKRVRVDVVTTILCDGACTSKTLASIGVYFGPADLRNLSARVLGTGFENSWNETRERVSRHWAELCALYIALKHAPAEGKVVIETPIRAYQPYIQRYKIEGRMKNCTYDTIIDSIRHLEHAGNRRIVVKYVKQRDRVQPATDLALTALQLDLPLTPTLPRLPVEEDLFEPLHSWERNGKVVI